VVGKKTSFGRAAFTMIELIFAIVIVSIAVISLPVMIQITSKGIESNIIQEAIFAASAELMGATSYYWDERSIEDNATSRLSRVIDVDGDCEDNASSPRYRLREGHVVQPYHRRCLNSSVQTGVNYTTAEADVPTLNKSVHLDQTQTIFVNPNKNAASYKEDYKGTMTIAKGLGNDNVKELTASIYNPDGTTLLTRLKVYSANIGEIDYYKRRF